jgi:hypothetical protein
VIYFCSGVDIMQTGSEQFGFMRASEDRIRLAALFGAEMAPPFSAACQRRESPKRSHRLDDDLPLGKIRWLVALTAALTAACLEKTYA